MWRAMRCWLLEEGEDGRRDGSGVREYYPGINSWQEILKLALRRVKWQSLTRDTSQPIGRSRFQKWTWLCKPIENIINKEKISGG